MPPINTSWQGVADWYDGLIESEGTYQKDLIAPNLLRLMAIRKGELVLDLACGQGFFAREFMKKGARVIGVDASPALVARARKNVAAEKAGAEFRVASADDLSFIKDASVDAITIILALQNIENVGGVLRECARVLKNGGTAYIVLNHPAFRVPKESGWGWDAEHGVQYRRIDRYLSESKVAIQMHPGAEPEKETLSFHRPLQFYVKALAKAGFAVAVLEEWNSHKVSEPGPRAKAEDRARKEIPLFMCFVARLSKPAR